MSTATLELRPDAPSTASGRVTAWLRDVWVMTRRNLIHVRREPQQLSDSTIQPVLFTLLFVSIFSASMVLPGGGDPKDFLVPGLLALNLTTGSVGTAIGLASDLHNGVIDRLRTLPMSQASVLFGRSISDLLSTSLCAAFVLLTGLFLGWRPTTGALSIVAGIALVIFFGYAISWFCGCIGLMVGEPEAAQGIAFIILFPLAFVSNAFAATQGMPTVLRVIANWNPVSAVTAGVRELFGNPNPSSTIDVWPMQHPVLAGTAWSVGILVVSATVATWLYRRKTSD
jgi:ABC transporter DrrB family efflux protein